MRPVQPLLHVRPMAKSGKLLSSGKGCEGGAKYSAHLLQCYEACHANTQLKFCSLAHTEKIPPGVFPLL